MTLKFGILASQQQPIEHTPPIWPQQRLLISNPHVELKKLTTVLGQHLDHHRVPLHHRQASYHLQRSVLQHRLRVLFPNTVRCNNQLTLLTVLHQAPQFTLTPPLLPPPAQLPPPRDPLAPPLPRPLLPPPRLPSLLHLATRLLPFQELLLLVSWALLLSSCKRPTPFAIRRSRTNESHRGTR